MVRLQCINYVTILGKREGNVLFDENRMLHKFPLNRLKRKKKNSSLNLCTYMLTVENKLWPGRFCLNNIKEKLVEIRL